MPVFEQATLKPKDSSIQSTTTAVAQQQTVNKIDKKFNVVMYGINECPQNTSKVIRQQSDLDNIMKVFAMANVEIESSSIKDFHRLGKFKPNHINNRPRPILIKFLRSTDAAKVLSSRSSFPFIKPDQTPDEWAKDLILLKER